MDGMYIVTPTQDPKNPDSCFIHQARLSLCQPTLEFQALLSMQQKSKSRFLVLIGIPLHFSLVSLGAAQLALSQSSIQSFKWNIHLASISCLYFVLVYPCRPSFSSLPNPSYHLLPPSPSFFLTKPSNETVQSN